MPRRRRRLISLEEAIEVGLRILDQDGLAALNMRRLARELGVSTMALYTHVATKDELLDHIAFSALRDLRFHPAPRPWQEQLMDAAEELLHLLERHPGLTDLMVSRPLPSPALDAFRESLLTVLQDAGFALESSVRAVRAIVFYTVGYSAYVRARREMDPEVETSRLRHLPRDAYPRLAASAAIYAEHISPESFVAGLRTFIDGLECELGRVS